MSRSSWRPIVVGIIFSFLFLLRLGYGLRSDFWTEDERQIYLIGLEAYARGEWPHFGPDVVWTGSRIPGALQGLLVALPLRLFPFPEAPFVVLNLLSFGVLGILAWTLARRLPQIPAWFIFSFLLTLPWTLNFSTHIVNPSYMIIGSILFFVGFLESIPSLRKDLLPRGIAFALMGFGLLWVAQLHLAWALLPLYLLVALASEARRGARALGQAVLAVALGALPMACLLVPTLWSRGFGGTERNIVMHFLSPAKLITMLAQFLSFGSYELNRFLGLSMARRIVLFLRNPWLAPPALILGLVGLLQPLVMIVLWFRRRMPFQEWRSVRFLTLGTLIWVYISYCFASKEPLAHAFYVVFPVSVVYSFYCWAYLAQYRVWRRVGALLLAMSVFLHGGLVIGRDVAISLYGKRDLVMTAIATRNNRLLGERRGAAFDPNQPHRSADPRSDIEIVAASWERVFMWKVSLFHLKLRNRGTRSAYVDLRYVVHYWDAEDRPLKDATGLIKQILEPGETRRFDPIVIGMVPRHAARAAFEIVDAERVVPRAW